MLYICSVVIHSNPELYVCKTCHVCLVILSCTSHKHVTLATNWGAMAGVCQSSLQPMTHSPDPPVSKDKQADYSRPHYTTVHCCRKTFHLLLLLVNSSGSQIMSTLFSIDPEVLGSALSSPHTHPDFSF